MDQNEILLGWLKDAYAMEMSLIPVLEDHAKDAQLLPQAAARIQQHVEETRRHADLVRHCVELLGGQVSGLKTGMATLFGGIKEIANEVSADEMVKNALADFATENFEIACYGALIAGAQQLGQQEVARVCQEILRDEQDMAAWLAQSLPLTVQAFIGQQGMSRTA